MTEEPTQEALDAFDAMVDDATHAAIEQFHALGLPEDTEQMSEIMVALNDAIAGVMRDWL